MKRRSFVKQATLMAAGLAARADAAAGRAQRLLMGAQTNTFGVPIKPFNRLLEVVADISKLGYQGFETNVAALEEPAANPGQARREFEKRDIRLIAAHSGGGLQNKKVADETVEKNRRIAGYTAAMGASCLIVSGSGATSADGKLDLPAAHAICEGLNRLGEVARKEGLKLSYHNHWKEFQTDPSEMSIILRETDPSLVWLNYDVGNPYGYGPNAAAFSAEHFRRIPIYHIKDVEKNSEGKVVPTDLGAGKIDLKGVVAPLLDSDWQGWLAVEREGNYPHAAEHPDALLRQCREYLRQITGV